LIFEHGHPHLHVAGLARRLPADATFEGSFYKYRPQSLLDERRVVKFIARDLASTPTASLLQDLEEGEEFALHSRVLAKHKRVHIPMVDFATTDLSAVLLVLRGLSEPSFREWLVYASGRSYHAYGCRFVDGDAWRRLMGLLLLWNMPESPPVVDARWVGHRLIAGYGSLRWSRNTAQSLGAPRFVSSVGMESSQQGDAFRLRLPPVERDLCLPGSESSTEG
jgi:hypothetical protein